MRQATEIDVIIMVYKPDKKFTRLLRGLKNQTIVPKRILLLNTGKQYWKEEWIQGIPEAEVYHIKEEEYDHGGTRRYGAELSTAPYMVFMTQDAVPANARLLDRLMQSMKDPQVAVAYARQIPYTDCNPVDAYSRGFNYSKESKKKTKADIETMGIKAFFCSDVCAIYRKSDYVQLGGFPEKTIFNEDMIFARKVLEAGKAIYYASEARVYHSHNDNCRKQLQRSFDLAVSQKQNPTIFKGIVSESEGIRMVKAVSEHLVKTGKWYWAPRLYISSIVKYIGFLLGKNYNKLPKGWVLKLTDNKRYWSK